jgi:hypothetical protein
LPHISEKKKSNEIGQIEHKGNKKRKNVDIENEIPQS